MKFYIPLTLEQDFIDWLKTDVPNINYDFELVRDWYARSQTGYAPVSLRAMLFSIEWKSKVGNSDASSNFKTSYAELDGTAASQQPVYAGCGLQRVVGIHPPCG